MGERAAVVFTTNEGAISPAVYLHWHGNPECVYPFLDELDRRRVRADACYEAARFCQIVGEFLDHAYRDGLSLGLFTPPLTLEPGALKKLNSWDHGVYVVNRAERGNPSVRRFVGRFGSTPSETRMVEVAAPAVAKERDRARQFARKDIQRFFAADDRPIGSKEHEERDIARQEQRNAEAVEDDHAVAVESAVANVN